MKACSITPYEGNKPYIFVSYAHKDSDAVFGIIEELDRRGYRVWYDDGVAPGSEWPEDIAQHLSGCYLTLACMSPNYIVSANCRRELTFALAKKKEFLAVMLEPTEMSLGLEMQLSAQLMLMKYNYTSDAAFYKKLCSCPDMEPCLEPKVAPAAAEQPKVTVTVEQPKTTVTVKAETPKTEKPRKEKIKREKPPKPPKEPKEKQPAKVKLIALAAVGIIAVAVLLGVVLSKSNDVTLLDDYVVEKDATSVSFHGDTITADVVKKLNTLEQLTTMYFANCSFEAGALEALQASPVLSSLTMSDCSGVSDLSFLNGVDLYRLELSGSGITDALLEGLSFPTVEYLTLSDNPGVTKLDAAAESTELVRLYVSGTGVTNLEGLATDTLWEVDFSDTAVADVSPLAAQTELNYVYGARSKVTDIDPLLGLEKLYTINFSYCPIEEIGGVMNSLMLSGLYFTDCGLTSLDAFQNCTILKKAYLGGNKLENVTILAKSRETLEVLELQGNPLEHWDVDNLVWFTKLTQLRLSDIPLENLNMLDGLTALEILEANRCGLRDISALADSVGLKEVYLHGNHIRDVSALSGMNTTNYVIMDLGANALENVSGLPGVKYKVLNLLDNPVNVSTMPAITGSNVLLDYSEKMLTDGAVLTGFSNCHILGCPADKQVALEGVLSSYRMKLYTLGEGLQTALADLGLEYAVYFEE